MHVGCITAVFPILDARDPKAADEADPPRLMHPSGINTRRVAWIGECLQLGVAWHRQASRGTALALQRV